MDEKENTITYHLEIKNIIESILSKLSIEFEEIEILKLENQDLKFIIKSKEYQILIGQNGTNFKALSHLIRKIVLKNRGLVKFHLDINNYQEESNKKIIDLALITAQKVRESNKSIEMRPMSSFERMIVHTLFSADSDVFTESMGERNERRVVIKLRR